MCRSMAHGRKALKATGPRDAFLHQPHRMMRITTQVYEHPFTDALLPGK